LWLIPVGILGAVWWPGAVVLAGLPWLVMPAGRAIERGGEAFVGGLEAV